LIGFWNWISDSVVFFLELDFQQCGIEACKNEVWHIFLQLTILVSKYLVINFNNFTVFNAHEIKDDSQNKERLNPSLEKEACSLIYQYIIYTY
jgi:hypothetical protein